MIQQDQAQDSERKFRIQLKVLNGIMESLNNIRQELLGSCTMPYNKHEC